VARRFGTIARWRQRDPHLATPHYGSPIYQVRATMGKRVHSGLPKVKQFSSPPRVASTRRRRWRRALYFGLAPRPNEAIIEDAPRASPRDPRTPSGIRPTVNPPNPKHIHRIPHHKYVRLRVSGSMGNNPTPTTPEPAPRLTMVRSVSL
jgi:hypothetical protein